VSGAPHLLRRNSSSQKILASAIVVAIAVFAGLLGATAGWTGQIVFISLLGPMVVLLFNYRIALFVLVLILPYSDAHFWPKLGPLSTLNLLLLGVIGMHLLHRLFDMIGGRHVNTFLPKEFVFLYFLPVTLGFVVGSFSLHDIPDYLVALDKDVADQRFYWVTLYFKGMLFPVAAFVLAACIIDQYSGRRVVYFSLASGLIFVCVGVWGWIESGTSLEAAVRSRFMFKFTGKDPNYVGFLLLPLLGVCIYLRSVTSGITARSLLLLVTAVLLAGLILTGSRAGLLGLVLMLLYVALTARNFRTLLFVCLLAFGAILFLPDAVLYRINLGVDDAIEDRAVVVKGDQLTSGRFYVYSQLIENVISSPFFGNGITSTLWSELVKGGYYISHPHSMYFSLLLDLGILGTIAMAAFAVTFFRWWGRLSRSAEIDPVMQKYFLGLRAGFVGYLGCAIGTGDAYPTTQQWFLWIGIAMAFRYRSFLSVEKVASPVSAKSFSQ
jgi:hypothetical protein